MSDIKTSIQTSKIFYRIEAKPEGGFLATSSDGNMPAIEAATREEVQQKIQAAIEQMIDTELPTLFKLGSLGVKLNTHINVTAGTGSGSLPSADPLSNSDPRTLSAPSAAPIVPERNLGTVLWVVIGLMVFAALLYFSYLR